MDADQLLRVARRRAGLSLRELALRAGTSHATLAAYEAGRKRPGADTLDRVLAAAGVERTAELRPAVGGADRSARGRELIDALELAAMFPARHDPELAAPVFPRTPVPAGASTGRARRGGTARRAGGRAGRAA
jgi:transcriptional regulator with XRE-family HTH domain